MSCPSPNLNSHSLEGVEEALALLHLLDPEEALDAGDDEDGGEKDEEDPQPLHDGDVVRTST